MSTLNLIQDMSKDIETLKNISGQMVNIMDYTKDNVNKMIALEQSIASLGKMIGGIAATLAVKGVITDDEVMDQIRKTEDRIERQRLDYMKENKLIQTQETIDELSLVVVSQLFTDKDGKIVILSECRSIEMPSQFVPATVKAQLIGMQVGFGLSHTEKSGTMLTTVKEIYNLIETRKEGEPINSEEAKGECGEVRVGADA